jgi:hypothetical protein
VSEEELQARVKALAAAEAAQAAAAAAADASAARAANKTSNGSSKKGAGAATARPSAVGTVSAERAGSAAPLTAAPSGPFAAAHNNLKDWGRRMEAYRQVVQEDAADLATKVRGVGVLRHSMCGCACCSVNGLSRIRVPGPCVRLGGKKTVWRLGQTSTASWPACCVAAATLQRAAAIAAYQAQLAAEAAAEAAAAAAAAATAAADASSEDTQAAAKVSSKPPAADKAGGSRMGTPRTHGKASAAGTDGCQLPPDVMLPEHGGFVAYFVEGGEQSMIMVGQGGD